MKIKLKYPIYIVSKGRWDSRLTSKSLESMGVPYFIVVEEQEYKQYCSVINKDKVLVLDRKYQDEYDTFDNLGNTKSKGPGAARNFAWEHSIDQGYKRHWVMDDNIHTFFRFNNNLTVPVADGTILRCMEDFVDRYINVAMAGPNYYMFIPRKSLVPPFVMNTRIYSCNLIQNDIHYRWRGRYNEDTDLSLRILKDGLCTIQFNAFLQLKSPTQTVQGGCTGEFYKDEGTLPKSKILVHMHPDVTRLVWKFSRWHHTVDYSKFKKNKLIKRKDINIDQLPKVDNYGMKFKIIKKKVQDK